MRRWNIRGGGSGLKCVHVMVKMAEKKLRYKWHASFYICCRGKCEACLERVVGTHGMSTCCWGLCVKHVSISLSCDYSSLFASKRQWRESFLECDLSFLWMFIFRLRLKRKCSCENIAILEFFALLVFAHLIFAVIYYSPFEKVVKVHCCKS